MSVFVENHEASLSLREWKSNRNVTRKGRNFGRPYYKCPGSDKENGIPDCTFYSFEDELKQCPCGRGYCRTMFPKGIKHWCCCVRGDGACSFFARIESTWQPPSSSTPPPHCQSPSSPSSRAQLNFSLHLRVPLPCHIVSLILALQAEPRLDFSLHGLLPVAKKHGAMC